MVECTDREAQEALPDLIHGRLSELDTATLRAHVESCASCRAEIALLREVRASAPLAPPMDISRIAAAIPAAAPVHVPAPARQAPSRFQLAFIGLAAVAALFAAGSLAVDRSEVVPPASSSVAASVSPSPEPAAVPQTSTPAQPAGVAGSEPSLALVAEVAALTDAELETLIAEVDGMDGMPSVEPQVMPISIDDIEGDSSSGAGE